ncbi:phosphoglycerate mutase-like protein [Gloeophyllum trabeum ATCC 11539]|uniref:Phosphoglycerate mutase-like protein n=1 Tax=Gloeophyllum trabeum (strain ATCC 11539 / FP-39264 / Madison 617) TaxID=670483 RepID=S7QDP1_GLOTA|nr:phosphoglycerate mutase-like protein [Gloeophyllum trabeum ATCC 11539]EPQ57951.1 phosphoglycerate mutase-like protein [Gloeophyllum trabeum ATCC 11539]
MPTTRVYIVRHGETAENRNGIMQGQLDSKLNEVGVEQAKMVAGALREVPFESAYSSDLSRAADTAKTILLYHPGVELRREEALRERHMGELQGKPIIARKMASAPDALEDMETFTARLVSWWDRAIVQAPARDHDRDVLVVSHGGAIGALVRALIASGKVKCGEGVVIWRVPNVSVTLIEVDEEGKGKVVKYADISFLEKQIEEALVDNPDERAAL